MNVFSLLQDKVFGLLISLFRAENLEIRNATRDALLRINVCIHILHSIYFIHIYLFWPSKINVSEVQTRPLMYEKDLSNALKFGVKCILNLVAWTQQLSLFHHQTAFTNVVLLLPFLSPPNYVHLNGFFSELLIIVNSSLKCLHVYSCKVLYVFCIAFNHF